tara:strand:- start:307 stop:1431 length:1125 start_codon:yes stop_codon:yes gene_type:complete
MAQFDAQVEALTGITISSSATYPTEAQLTEFLKDGVIDVTNRCLAMKPQEVQNFQRVSAIIDSNGGLDLGGAKIISVLREATADGSSDGSTAWRPCRQISPALESRVVDADSLEFASKYNPVYMLADNNKINVYPAPDDTNDGYKVYYVNNIPTDETNETSLIFSHSDIKYFPNDKIYLVVIYAAMRSLQSAMGGLHANVAVTDALDNIETAVDQAAAAADKFIIADSDSIFGDESSFLTNDSQLARVKDALDNAEKIIDDGANSPTGNAAGDAATYLYTDEDTELLQGALGIASSEIQRAQVHIAEWTAIGDMRVKEIQAALQEAQGYAAEAQANMTYLAQEYQWYTQRYAQLKFDYNEAFNIGAPKQEATAK